MFKKPCYSDNIHRVCSYISSSLVTSWPLKYLQRGRVPRREFSPNWWVFKIKESHRKCPFLVDYTQIKDHKIPAGNSDFVELLLLFFFPDHMAPCANFLFHAAKAIFDWLNWHIEIEPATCATTIRRCLDDTRPQWNVYKLGVCIPGLFDLHIIRDTFAFPPLSF